MEQLELLNSGDVNWYNHFGNSLAVSAKIKYIPSQIYFQLNWLHAENAHNSAICES